MGNEARDLQIQNWFQESIAGRQCGRSLPSRSLALSTLETSGYSAIAPAIGLHSSCCINQPNMQPVEHLKNAAQNITTDRTPHIVCMLFNGSIESTTPPPWT